MKTQFVRALLVVCFAAGGPLLATSLPAMAAEAAKEQPVSKAVGLPLSDALKLAQAKDFTTALIKVKEAQAVPDRTPYDDFKINQVLGFVAINLNDHATATTAFEAMAESPAMPEADAKDTLHNAMLLANESKHYQKVVQYSQMAEKAGGMDDKEQGALAQSYYFMGNYAQSLAVAQKSVAQANAAGQMPDRGVLDVIVTAQVKQKDQAGALQTLEVLAQDYGAAEDWGQVIELALGTKGGRDLDWLNLYRLRLATNATIPADDYALMAGIASHLGYPGEATAILERGQANGAGKIGAALAAARGKEAEDKRSLPSFDAQARKHPTGDFDVKLAETYYGYGRYAEAEEAARRSITKGGTKDAQEAPMVLGMALAMQGKNAEAAQTFSQVKGTPAIEKTAHLWSLYAGRKYGGAAAPTPAPAK